MWRTETEMNSWDSIWLKFRVLPKRQATLRDHIGLVQKKCTSNVKVPMERPRYLPKSSADLQRIYNQITRHSLNLFTSRRNPHVMLMLPPSSHRDGSQHTTFRAATGLPRHLTNLWQIHLDLIFRGLQVSWGWNEKGLTKFKRPIHGSCSAKQLLTPHW